MGKVKINTNSYDFIQDSINGSKNYFQLVDFNVFKTKEEMDAANYGGIRPWQRKMFYEEKLFPFMQSFDPEKFLRGFAKTTDRERLNFLNEPKNTKNLQYIVWLAEHSERIITDIYAIKADKTAGGFTTPGELENEIRMQAKLYKPFLEVLKCMSDKERYKRGEQPFEKKELSGVRVAKKGKYTDEMTRIDVSITGTDKSDALEKKNKDYKRLVNKVTPVQVTEEMIEHYGLQAAEGFKYLKLHQGIKALDPTAGFTVDKDAFQKEHLEKLCAAIKETDPKHVISNTKEFRRMRNCLYSFTKNYDNLTTKQKQLAANELKKLTLNYIIPRKKRYKDEMERLPNEPEYMNERSRTRFELAKKLAILCDVAKCDDTPLPKHAQLDGDEKTITNSRTADRRMMHTKIRPMLPKEYFEKEEAPEVQKPEEVQKNNNKVL